MLIETSLKNNGFKHRDIVGCKDMYENCDKFYQLKVYKEDSLEKLYSVNCHLYDFSDNMVAPDFLKRDLQAMFKVQFTTNSGEVFNVEYSTQNVEEALQFFDKMYTSMNCVAYGD